MRSSHRCGAIYPTAASDEPHRKKDNPFSGNATHPPKIVPTPDRAKSGTDSEEEFVF